MDFTSSFAISSAGMRVERTRVDVAALNLANLHTIRGADGRAYQPLRVITQPDHASNFAATFDAALSANEAQAIALPTAVVEAVSTAPRAVHQPTHPLADAQGFIYYPGIDHTQEMFTLMAATRAYEANVVAFQASRALVMKTLEIGGGP